MEITVNGFEELDLGSDGEEKERRSKIQNPVQSGVFKSSTFNFTFSESDLLSLDEASVPSPLLTLT